MNREIVLDKMPHFYPHICDILECLAQSIDFEAHNCHDNHMIDLLQVTEDGGHSIAVTGMEMLRCLVCHHIIREKLGRIQTSTLRLYLLLFKTSLLPLLFCKENMNTHAAECLDHFQVLWTSDYTQF